MDELKKQQVEALQLGVDYVQKLIPATEEIILELRGEEKEDTIDYLNQIVDGLNFVIEIVNSTLSFINAEEVILNRDGIEEKIQQFSKAFMKKDKDAIALEFETGILPFLQIFLQVAKIFIEKNPVE